MKSNVGSRIKHYRKKNKLTQEQLAERADVSASLISKAETNRTGVGLDNIIRIAEALEVPIEFIMEHRAEAEVVRNNIIDKITKCDKPVLHIVEDVLDAMVISINRYKDAW